MRLIDADELMEHVWRDKLDSRELIATMVNNAPTVIDTSKNMLLINEYDSPIQVAEKIIKGTKEMPAGLIDKATYKALTGKEIETITGDMFDLEEIKEIAGYLMVYYDSHKNED